MSLDLHRKKEYLGGIVYLLTIDMSEVTGDPNHVKRYVNNFGRNGGGIKYQGNTFSPYPYEIKNVKRNQKANKSGSKLTISDNKDLEISRFVDEVGGSLQGARIYEFKVYSRFLDDGEEPNNMAYTKRLDHTVSYVEDSIKKGEVIVHTIDPLSRDVSVPSISFSAGDPNSTESLINVFPAVNRMIAQGR